MLLASAALLACLGVASAQPFEPTPPSERLVGMAYSTWFPPVSWDRTWDKPLLGPYNSADPRIIRQHAEWLADAGVDFIWVDWSNNLDLDHTNPAGAQRLDLLALENATRILFDEYTQLERRPKISIFLGYQDDPEKLNDGRLRRKADQVYETYVQNPRFRPLLQDYLGKPLLVIYVGTPNRFTTSAPPWDDDRFTVRWMTGFITEQPNLWSGEDRVSHYGYWSWEDRGKQTYAVHDGRPEAMTVVACWRDDPNCPTPGRRDGETFRQEWARAREIGPKFAMVVSWNEWGTGEQPSVEVSKDIEPSQVHGTFYLDLLKEQIAAFKSE